MKLNKFAADVSAKIISSLVITFVVFGIFAVIILVMSKSQGSSSASSSSYSAPSSSTTAPTPSSPSTPTDTTPLPTTFPKNATYVPYGKPVTFNSPSSNGSQIALMTIVNQPVTTVFHQKYSERATNKYQVARATITNKGNVGIRDFAENFVYRGPDGKPVRCWPAPTGIVEATEPTIWDVLPSEVYLQPNETISVTFYFSVDPGSSNQDPDPNGAVVFSTPTMRTAGQPEKGWSGPTTVTPPTSTYSDNG